jgi:hypothetical protein
MGLTSSGGVAVNCKLQARASSRPVLSSHVITTPKGPVRLQGESGVAARLVPVTVDGLILAAPEADRISVGAALMRLARGHYANWP